MIGKFSEEEVLPSELRFSLENGDAPVLRSVLYAVGIGGGGMRFAFREVRSGDGVCGA